MTIENTPLEIAQIEVGLGCIGIAPCPGRGSRKTYGRRRDRNLNADLCRIKAWGAVAVVSVLEEHEMGWLQVPHLGEEIERHGMEWLLLPVKDGNVPDEGAEHIWSERGPRIRAMVEDGRRVLFHCRAGRGRSGMMAARTLIELGWGADAAIAEVRRVRQGAIERPGQEAAVRSWGGVTTMSKSPTVYGAAFGLAALQKAGYGDSRLAQAFRLTLQRQKERNGKPAVGQDERMMASSLKKAPEG
jgi:ADP-ribosyl-[dinitrogen reductase] hydrolase